MNRTAQGFGIAAARPDERLGEIAAGAPRTAHKYNEGARMS